MPGLVSCTTSPASPTGNGYDVATHGTGTPSIILVHGLGDDRATWRAVIEPLSSLSTTLAFNRPGYGRSPQTDRPRDATTISDEIRMMLSALSMPAPYLLVGHSLGGVYAQVFARRFPSETAGLVLVDTTLPGQTRYLRTSAAAQFATVTAIMNLQNPTVRREFQEADAAESQVEQFAPYSAGPVVLLEATEPDALSPQAFTEWRHTHMRDLARAYHGDLRQVRSGHFIQREQPREVIAAVQTVLSRARGA